MIEKSYVMVKPEFANHQIVINEIKTRLVSQNLTILKEAFVKYDVEHAREHYAEHVEKDFYPNLENYLTSDKAYGMIVAGEDAIKIIRKLVGSTKDPAQGTIRFDIPQMLEKPLRVTQNVVHASDSPEAAEREINIFLNLLNENKD